MKFVITHRHGGIFLLYSEKLSRIVAFFAKVSLAKVSPNKVYQIQVSSSFLLVEHVVLTLHSLSFCIRCRLSFSNNSSFFLSFSSSSSSREMSAFVRRFAFSFCHMKQRLLKRLLNLVFLGILEVVDGCSRS